MWLKILKMYSNKFPMFAIVSYLYKYGKDEEYVDFLKLLTRVCYSYGPSTTVKFTIYNIIADIFSEVIKKKKSVDYFMPNLESLNTRYHLKKVFFAYLLYSSKTACDRHTKCCENFTAK